jgi:hypothetical protein
MPDEIVKSGAATAEPSESESEQDLAQIEGETDADSDTDEDSGEESDEDRAPSHRARGGAKEDKEDTEAEEDDEEDEETKLGDIEDEDEEEGEGGEEEVKEPPEYTRLPIRAVKEKYPNLFKDFPQLKAAFFGYPQFMEVFADIDSAREAANKAVEYDALEQSLVEKGDAKFFLSTLNENNPKALKKLLSGFSETLKGVDQTAYLELSTPIIEELLYHAAAHGSKVGNKNLSLAARHIANFVFANGGEIPDISKRGGEKKPSEAEVQLQTEREQYANEKFRGALEDVINLINPDMNAILNNKLDGLSPFEKKQIVKESRTEINRILENDKGFQAQLRNLWKKASETGYSSESKSRIKRAWLDRAKLVAPSVRNRLKQEALSAKTPGKKTSEEKEGETKVKFKVTDKKKTFPERGGKTPSGSSRRVLDPKQIDWRKTTDKDILDM